MEEKWKQFYTMDEIQHIQKVELETLQVFLNLCEKLKIKCYLYGGSMLGAVKYNGFVPWDDDLDLALLRTDYEKLISEGPDILDSGYEIQHPEIHKVTPYPYIKFRRKGTTMVEYTCHRLKMCHGIYLDIYPIDNIPDDNSEYERMHSELQKTVRRYLCRQISSLDYPVKSPVMALKAFRRYAKSKAMRLIPRYYFINKMNRIMTKYNDQETKRQGNYFYPKPVNFFDGVEPSVEVSFEDYKLRIPKGYMINLTNRYGNISELPPEDKRIGHKPYILEFGEKKTC